MTTLDLVKECILSLKDRTGSSVPAINKWIEAEKKKSIKKHVLRAALKNGIEKGMLVPVKASYKLSAEAKKPAPKKKIVKKKTVKKAPTKKSSTSAKNTPTKKLSKKNTGAVKKKAKSGKSTTKKAASKKKVTKRTTKAPKK